MQFEEDDEFGDIVAVIQGKLNGLSGVLHMPGVIGNAPDYLLPVRSWNSFRLFSKIRETMSVLNPPPGDGRMNFVWVSVLLPLWISRLLLEIMIECIN
jgi:hypothetical protein